MENFYFKYFKYNFLIILAFFYWSSSFKSRNFLVIEYFHNVLLVFLLQLKIWVLPPSLHVRLADSDATFLVPVWCLITVSNNIQAVTLDPYMAAVTLTGLSLNKGRFNLYEWFIADKINATYTNSFRVVRMENTSLFLCQNHSVKELYTLQHFTFQIYFESDKKKEPYCPTRKVQSINQACLFSSCLLLVAVNTMN